jgi:hypothetical protein
LRDVPGVLDVHDTGLGAGVRAIAKDVVEA